MTFKYEEGGPLYPSQKMPFRFNGIAKLVSTSCTLAQAESMLRTGEVTSDDFKRYKRIWNNMTFRYESKSQDMLYAIGGQPAVERRYARAKKLHAAWRRKVSTLIAQYCLSRGASNA